MYKIIGYLVHMLLLLYKKCLSFLFTSFGNNIFLMWGEINLSPPFFSPGSGTNYSICIIPLSHFLPVSLFIHLLSPVDVLITAHLNLLADSIWGTILNLWCLFWAYIYLQWFITSWKLTFIELSPSDTLMDISVIWETWN